MARQPEEPQGVSGLKLLIQNHLRALEPRFQETGDRAPLSATGQLVPREGRHSIRPLPWPRQQYNEKGRCGKGRVSLKAIKEIKKQKF